MRAVGKYLRARNALVAAFYVSNVEQYLRAKAAWTVLRQRRVAAARRVEHVHPQRARRASAARRRAAGRGGFGGNFSLAGNFQLHSCDQSMLGDP